MLKHENQQIYSSLFQKKGITLFIKRIDKNHKYISGNKLYKLKYNISRAKKEGYNTLLTFGGAYSNHIVATSCIAHENNLNSIGIIRGDKKRILNSTLKFAKEQGMKLYYVGRKEYRMKGNVQFIDDLRNKFGDFYLIPEGGTNILGIKGAQEILDSRDTHDYLCVPVGTGGTISGIVNSSDVLQKVLGFNCVKGEGSLYPDISSFTNKNNWRLIDDYLFGGYAKTRKNLLDFINQFHIQYNIGLDVVYTSKMMFGVLDLIKKNYFKRNSSILAIHTGGLQGNKGMNERFNFNLPTQF